MKEQNVYDLIVEKLHDDNKIDELVSFNETNIIEKLQNNTYLVIQYNELYFKEKNILDKLNEKRDVLVGQRYDYYRFNYDKALKQGEIEKYYLPKDGQILKINEIIKRQQIRVDFFLLCAKQLEKQQWNMKSFLDATRIGL